MSSIPALPTIHTEPEEIAEFELEPSGAPETQDRQNWFAATIRKPEFFLEFLQKLIFEPESV